MTLCLCLLTGRNTRPLLLVDDCDRACPPPLGDVYVLLTTRTGGVMPSCVPGLVSTYPRVLGDVNVLAILGRYGTLMG